MNRRDATVRVSKLLSLMLRHRPQEFDVSVDAHGFAALDDVLAALQSRDGDITLEDVEKVVYEGEKARFEIVDDRIRARYGHSFEIDLGQDPVEPPETLYKGVAPGEVDKVMKDGLDPFDRSYVHLSFEADVAARLGRGGNAVIAVNATAAHQAGVEFFDCGSTILTKFVPADYLSVEREVEVVRAAVSTPRPASPPKERTEPETSEPDTSEQAEPQFGRRRRFKR